MNKAVQVLLIFISIEFYKSIVGGVFLRVLMLCTVILP